ncbi:cytochrome P450 2J6-like isoform X2 [Physella acuta]|uniref:cytochrome P450 2J6-like isoform X2 n=1 Tax=Physella acuta TaxID=109671 RepID=UPI0027DDE04A|nr:cytochrome P450 2J6-like isoform X2 [Physella acuta]
MSISIAVNFLIEQIYNHPNTSAVVSVSSLLLWLAVRRPFDIPPNPWFIFPIIGHRPLLRGDPVLTLRRLRRELGEVFSVYIDAQLVIIVNGLAAIKEAFMTRGEEFHWRPSTRICDLFHFGVICNSGKEWRDQRRVTEMGIHHTATHVHQLVDKEVAHLITAIKQEEENPFNPNVLLHSAVFNAISSIIFSRRMDYKDVRLTKAIERFKENLELFSDTKYPNFFPFQKFLMGDFFDVKFLRINMTEIHQKIINPVYEEHKSEYSDERVVDFLDVYLREIKNHKGVDKTTVEERSCQAVLYDLLWHGTVTTGATLYWALVFLLKNPGVADTVRDHLEPTQPEGKSEGSGDTTKERANVPTYIKAFLYEVQRCANVCPLSMAHAVAKEKFLKGYRIPGDAVILPNLDSLMMDEDVWGDPQVFRPERFINSDGKLSVPPEFIPFFIGIRGCPASNIAETILSSFLVSMISNFSIEPEVAGTLPSAVRRKGLIPYPPEFKTRFISRH